jgi:hypothetical protein
VLQGNEGTPAGTIKIDKELVTFEGNFDESAQVFIEHLARRWSQQWRDLEKRANEFDRFMDAMDTAKEALAAGTPLDLESLFKGEMASAMFATMFAGEFVRSGAETTWSWGTTFLKWASLPSPSSAKKARRQANVSLNLRPLLISVTASVFV